MDITVLQDIAETRAYDDLDITWRVTDLVPFSHEKRMYPYQRQALQNAILALQMYYENYDNIMYEVNMSDLPYINRLKVNFFNRYKHLGLAPKLINQLHVKEGASNFDVLSDYYPLDDDGKIGFQNFANRMSFWMATGSGKSLVILKLMEVLIDLVKYDKIPDNNVLFLTHKQKIIDQLLEHAKEFNRYLSYEKGYEIIFRDLREFPELEYQCQTCLFKDRYINIFYYRSDLLSEKKKDNQVDFREYVNCGNWYTFLDEAHRGKSDDSKKKQYINILSQNGFIFNFSATFTDDLDLLTTVYNFNLSEFIKAGYGKRLYISKSEFDKTFKKVKGKEVIEEYTIEEKQRIVLMSLIQLTYIKKRYHKIRQKTEEDVFHNPLLLTLVNSVSSQDSDLVLFFRELEKIAKGEILTDMFEQAKKSLYNEYYTDNSFTFDTSERLDIGKDIKDITLKDLLQNVFNTSSNGSFEVMRNPKNKQELCFSVKSSGIPEPFALIKIGDTDKWIKEILSDFDIEEDYTNTSVFDNLNESSVNILMGSRAFYEGWDSNRPNVINFINIGTSKEAKKFILQSIGRGVRVEPVKNQRKRLKKFIYSNDDAYKDLLPILEDIKPLETLFIFGTKRSAIQSVLDTLDDYSKNDEEYLLDTVEKVETDKKLFIPLYKQKSGALAAKVKRYPLHPLDFKLFSDIMETMDDATIILNFNLSFQDFKLLKNKYEEKGDNFSNNGKNKIGNPSLLLRSIINYFKIIPEEIDDFKEVEDDIKHYKHIKVALPLVRFKELKQKVDEVKKAQQVDDSKIKEIAIALQTALNISEEEAIQKAKETASSKDEVKFSEGVDELLIKKIEKYYYTPLFLSNSDKIKWIKHIIDDVSEVKFIKRLEAYLKEKDNFFDGFDWWMFSKIDHTLDKNVRIPYIDLAKSEKRNFLPDFVFWLAKGDEYYIIYIDPKGTGRSEYQYKIDGYSELFEENGNPKVFNVKGKKVRVLLKMFTEDKNVISDYLSYKKYWMDDYSFGDLKDNLK